MIWYSIFFRADKKSNWLPVYEGKNGQYWLGGTPSHMYPLIFSAKKQADAALKRIFIVEVEQADEPKSIFQKGEFAVKRCEIVTY